MATRERRNLLTTAAAVVILCLGLGIAQAQSPVQIINSSPDPAVALLDVYVDGVRVADDLAFKAATPFVDQFGTPQILVTPTSTVDVVAATDPDNSSPLVSKTLLLTGGVATLIEVIGVVDPTAFDPNPNGRDTSLAIAVFEGYKPAATDPTTAELMAVHVAPDLGAVDLIVRTVHDQPGQGIPLYTNLQYGDFQPYLALAPSVATLDLVESGTTNVIETWVATFGLVVGAGVVGHASGFLNPPTQDQRITLFGAVASGFVFELANGSVTAVGDGVPGPVAFDLGQAYPNPFNPKTVIPFSLFADQQVSLRVYDLKGRLIDTLVDGSMGAGDYAIPFEPRDLASGAYLYRLETDTGARSGVMTLVK